MAAEKRAQLNATLPPELWAQVERLRKRRGESRGDVVRRALRRLVAGEQAGSVDAAATSADPRGSAVAAYVAGYRRRPESDAEVAAALAGARELLALEPWE